MATNRMKSASRSRRGSSRGQMKVGSRSKQRRAGRSTTAATKRRAAGSSTRRSARSARGGRTRRTRMMAAAR